MKYNICAIGDSHSGTFYPYCKTITLGPVTMYSLTTDKLYEYIDYLLKKEDITKNNWWLFCVGEIDVRCLLFKQIFTYGRSEDEVIDTLVSNYISNLLTLEHKNIIVSTTVAPAQTTGFEDKLANTINSPYPFIGSDEDRNRWSYKINQTIINKCKEKNIQYTDIYNLFKNKQGFLDQDYIDADLVHVLKRDKVVTALERLKL